MDIRKVLEEVTEVAAIVVGFVCGVLGFCIYVTEVGWYPGPGVLAALPCACAGYWIVWLVSWLSKRLTGGPKEGVKPAAEHKRRLNRKQRICLWVGIAAFVLIGILPPWACAPKSSPPGGHAFILSEQGLSYARWCEIDLYRLCFEWAMVAVIAGGLIVRFREKKPRVYKESNPQR